MRFCTRISAFPFALAFAFALLLVSASLARATEQPAFDSHAQWSDEEEEAFFVELEVLTRDMSEEELRGIVDNVVDRVASTCSGWIDSMKSTLSSSVTRIQQEASGSINGVVTSLATDVSAYVRTTIVTPFQNFEGKLDSAKAEVQTVITSVTRGASVLKDAIVATANTLARRVGNPLNIPDNLQCTPPSFLAGPDATPIDRQTWCKVAWAADRLGIASLFDKVGSLVERHTTGISSAASAFLEVQAASTRTGNTLELELGSAAHLRDGSQALHAAALRAQLSANDCLKMRAAATVLDGLDKSCNLLLSALDTESVTQWVILGLASVFKAVATGMKAACAAIGSF